MTKRVNLRGGRDEARELVLIESVFALRPLQAFLLDDVALTQLLRLLVVDVHEVAELFGENASPVVERKLATRHNDLDRLLQVASCSLQEAQHQVL